MLRLGIRRPIATLMLVLGIILFSAVSFFRIPVELYPNTDTGEISVITRLRGGIAASEVEKNVTQPLEASFSEINGLKEIISASRESESVIVLKFHQGIDTDFIVIDVREKLAMVRHLLPKEVEKPIIAKFQQSDTPIIIVSLSSDIHSPEKLREIAEEKIKEKIMRIAGVANVEIGGGRERKFLIEVDNSRLLAYRLPILSVVEKINLANISISAGEIRQHEAQYIIRATGEYTSIAEIENTGIAITPTGSVIRLKDIAVVRDSYYEPTYFARLNVKPVVSLYVQKESTANTITVAKQVEKEVGDLQRLMKEEMTITVVKNDAEFIRKAISSLNEALGTGALLLAAILFVFMRNVRSILIIITTLPLSLFLSVLMVYFSGLSFNVMTLSGLAMGLANVMDNAIVILENISFHYMRRTFKDRETMIVEGTRELALPIIASTMTTVIVFLPLVFLDPEIRQLYVPFALTITFALIASLISTLVFVPPQVYRWQNNFRLDFQEWYKKVRKTYRRMLAFSFRYQVWVWGVVTLLFVFSLFILSRRDSEFMDPGDANTFRIGIQFPPATRIERSDETVKKIEKALLSDSDVVRVSSKVEKLHTFIEVKVARDADKFKNKFRKRFNEFSPAFVYYQESQSAGASEIFIDFYGHDYETLKQLAFASSGRLGQVKGLTDIKIRMREDEPEMNLLIDRDKMALFNLSTLYLGNTLHCQLRGLIATQYRSEGKQIETICRLFPGSVKKIDELPFLGVISPYGDILQLGQIGLVKQVKATQEIWHKNKKRFIQISANRADIGLGAAAEKITKVLKSIAFPRDYSFNLSGDYEKTVRNKQQFALAIAMTVILIYLVLASLFESYLQPLLIMCALPLSIIGVAISLWAFDKPLSLGVWIGLMILFGSVVYSSIILVEKINTRRKGRTNLARVVFESCKERLRPELITLLMKTLGLVPMVLSRDEAASMWRSLGMTVLFGTVTGTLLTLLVVPVAYLTMEHLAQFIPTLSIPRVREILLARRAAFQAGLTRKNQLALTAAAAACATLPPVKPAGTGKAPVPPRGDAGRAAAAATAPHETPPAAPETPGTGIPPVAPGTIIDRKGAAAPEKQAPAAPKASGTARGDVERGGAAAPKAPAPAAEKRPQKKPLDLKKFFPVGKIAGAAAGTAKKAASSAVRFVVRIFKDDDDF
ncbi:MAG: efflux RND transporter permease subunit [Endomicrobiales bacterium]